MIKKPKIPPNNAMLIPNTHFRVDRALVTSATFTHSLSRLLSSLSIFFLNSFISFCRWVALVSSVVILSSL